MTVLEAVKQSKTTPRMCKSAIETAQNALTTPETVLWAHTGNVTLDERLGGAVKGLHPGVTVITTHRVLFSCCVLGNGFIRSLPLPDITDTQSKLGLAVSSLQISSPAGQLVIDGNNKTIPELTSALENAIEASAALDPAELEPFYTPVTADIPEAPPIRQEETPAPSPEIAPEDVDLEPYFQTYYPSRSRAARKLHQDTGLDIQQCKQMVETYFSANLARVPMPKKNSAPDLKHLLDPEKAARMDELDRQGIAYCPKCASTSISVGKRGFSVGKAVATSLFFSTGASLVAGAAGANKKECFCMKCGHTWQP